MSDFRQGKGTDRQWIETCVQAGEFLYGIFPMSVLKKLVERRGPVSYADLLDCVNSSDAILMEFVEGALLDEGDDFGFLYPVQAEGELRQILEQAERDGNPYADIHLDEEVHIALLDEQGEVDFYIPTRQEIEELTQKGYIRTPAMTELEKYAMAHGMDASFARDMWAQVSTDRMDAMEAIRFACGRLFAHADAGSLDELNEAVRYVQDYINSINLRARRGWSPDKLFKKQGGFRMPKTIVPGSVHAARIMKKIEPELAQMGLKVDYDAGIGKFVTTGPFGEKMIVKVGRNDPCPCGSGKKYKRCHGR